MKIVPISFADAKAFIAANHRHNKPPQGWKFGCALMDGDKIVGVATAGRPIARHFDDGKTIEVNRSCTDGTKNANSMLYGAIRRAAKALGYEKLITYTQLDESGVSLKAAGWTITRVLDARKSWAESSVKMRATRDPVGNGGVPRVLWTCVLLSAIIGCTPAPTKPIVQYKTVEVPTYIRAPIPPEYTVDRIVAEPQPACRLIGPPAIIVFCQNQVAELIDSYRAALRQSNLDKAALRSLDKQP